MASYTYKGYVMSGYDTSGVTFPSANIASAKLWGTYINLNTGNVYQCVDLGEPMYGYVKTADKSPQNKVYFKRSYASDGSTQFSAITSPIWTYYRTRDSSPSSSKTYFEMSRNSDGSIQYSAITTPIFLYKKTADKSINYSKVYYTRKWNSAGTELVYTAVSGPKAEDLGIYYERNGYDMSRYYERAYDMSEYFERRVLVAAGSPTKAKWKYVRTDIVGKPSPKVSSLTAPERQKGSLDVKVSWKVPEWLTDEKNGRRADSLYFRDGVTGRKVDSSGKSSSTDEQFNSAWAKLAIDRTGVTRNALKQASNRSKYYPLKAGRYLTGYYFELRAHNAKGEGSSAKVNLPFKKPLAPTVSAARHDTSSGEVTFEVTPAADSGGRERYDTRYKLVVFDSLKKKSEIVLDKAPTTGSKFEVTYDVRDRQLLGFGQYVQVTLTAWSRGLAGDSAQVSRSIVVGYPACPTVKNVSVPSKSGRAKVTVEVSTNSTKLHPVDGVRLQTLVNTDAATAAEAELEGGWKDTDMVDDGECKALAVTVADLVDGLEAGKHVWVRVKAWNDDEDMFARTSRAMEVKALYTPAPTAGDDAVDIISATPGADGASAVVRVGWFAGDDSTHTEVSWSEDEDAWDSTSQPRTYDLDDKTWAKEAATVDGVKYAHTATVVVKDLEEGTTYYVSARRWQKSGDEASYGDYCAKAAVLPATSPTSVVLAAPSAIARGRSAAFSWSYDSTAAQKTWRLMQQVGDEQGKADKVIARGTDPLGTCAVAWSRIAALLPEDGVLRAYVAVSTGGAEVVSETVSAAVADPPALSMEVPETLSAQPLALSLSCTDPEAEVSVVVTAAGCSGETPAGAYTQAEGDAVLSEVYAPAWELDGDTGLYTAQVEAPEGLQLRERASYAVVARATDAGNGLASPDVEASFAVAWAHQAPQPPSEIAVEPYDETDGDGRRTVGARVSLGARDYAPTSDTEAVEGKAYYEASTRLEPTPDAEVEEGKAYYEVETSYAPVTDDELDPAKDYYEVDSETGGYAPVEEPSDSELDTYYTRTDETVAVEPQGGEDPSALGWLERVTIYTSVEPYEGCDPSALGWCELAPVLPDGMAPTDVYDVYRVTPDGADLIAAGKAAGDVVDDPYAPFGDADLRYRVAVRTADGDEEWADYGYAQPVQVARFDFAGEYVELEYGIALSDAMSKDGGVRYHMDGTRSAHVGNVARTGSVSAVLVRFESAAQAELLRALGRHRGTAFVRLPNGCAYEAVVQVPDISESNDSAALSVQIKTEEVDLSADYAARMPEEGGE